MRWANSRRARYIVPLEDGRFVCQLYVQASVVIGGLGDGLGGVEWEAEVAFGVTPGIFGFAGFLMAVIGGEGGAEFIGAVRFWVIDEGFMGERILLFLFGEAVEHWRELRVRSSPLLLDFLGEFGEGADGALVRANEALGSGAT